MTTIDKNSIRVSKTGDSSVYRIDFDFTDDEIINDEGWNATWLHTAFTSGLDVSDPEFEAAGNAAMDSARRPVVESDFETALQIKYGTSVIRSNPTTEEPLPQKVSIVSVDESVVMKVTT